MSIPYMFIRKDTTCVYIIFKGPEGLHYYERKPGIKRDMEELTFPCNINILVLIFIISFL